LDLSFDRLLMMVMILSVCLHMLPLWYDCYVYLLVCTHPNAGSYDVSKHVAGLTSDVAVFWCTLSWFRKLNLKVY